MATKISPTLRTKHRYLLLEGATRQEIESIILDYLGILGWAKATPFFVEHSGKGIVLAVDRAELENVKAAFALAKPSVVVRRVSGTLKGLT